MSNSYWISRARVLVIYTVHTHATITGNVFACPKNTRQKVGRVRTSEPKRGKTFITSVGWLTSEYEAVQVRWHTGWHRHTMMGQSHFVSDLVFFWWIFTTLNLLVAATVMIIRTLAPWYKRTQIPDFIGKSNSDITSWASVQGTMTQPKDNPYPHWLANSDKSKKSRTSASIHGVPTKPGCLPLALF